MVPDETLATGARIKGSELLAPDVTIENAAAPESTLKLLLLALGAGAVVLLPSLLYLFQIFKRQEQR